jgi:hypothetical protein
MLKVFTKSEDLSKSPPIVGYEIARHMKRCKKTELSIFDIARDLKSEPWFSATSLMYGLIFLYSVGIIEFDEPYLKLTDAH